ncbi:MDS1 and EVI1 complex locus protein EVI1-B [Frankliniella fusca]|uniref:MDS1 and EVI1 complex locus protein EVI1-B n=1 Tax=Frankliniella fusca TaxID=407009 RepID=A0AAE1LEU1_9NEOP|nr:MDS1 and EVI1 complex locus protein EVI1-B [Frankliniella fusca]
MLTKGWAVVPLAPRRPSRGSRQLLQCEHCDYSCPRPADLRKHLRTHTGERPYKCHHCDRWFGDISNRRAHMRKWHASEMGQ